MPDYSIQQIGAADFNLLIPLMKDCFGMDVNIDYFRWKYLNNPAGHFIGFVAVENQTGEIGAYYGVIPEHYWIDGTERTIYQSCDTMTHSRHRRRGLFQKLALHCYDYIRKHHYFFIIGFGGGQSTPGFLKFGWKNPFDFRYYFKPRMLCRDSFLLNFPSEAFRMDENPQNLVSLLETLKNNTAIHSNRTVNHLQWRIQNPLYQYKIVSFRNSGKMTGYVIYYMHQDKLFLFDFVFTDKASRKALIGYVSRIVCNNGYKGIVAFCQENGLAATQLRKSFFLVNPFSKGPLSEITPFIYFTDQGNYDSSAAWQITSYDHDAL